MRKSMKFATFCIYKFIGLHSLCVCICDLKFVRIYIHQVLVVDEIPRKMVNVLSRLQLFVEGLDTMTPNQSLTPIICHSRFLINIFLEWFLFLNNNLKLYQQPP